MDHINSFNDTPTSSNSTAWIAGGVCLAAIAGCVLTNVLNNRAKLKLAQQQREEARQMLAALEKATENLEPLPEPKAV